MRASIILALVKKSLFFSYTLKWCTILFYINKASCIFIPFYPLFCFGIKNLRTFFSLHHCDVRLLTVDLLPYLTFHFVLELYSQGHAIIIYRRMLDLNIGLFVKHT